MTDLAGAAREFGDLAKNLQLVGAVELRAELYKAINAAAKQIQPEIRAGMKDYFPDPYAAVLDADLALSTSKRTGADPGVLITARTRSGRARRLRRFDEEGVLGHPVFGMRMRSNPRLWAAWVFQTSHVRPGFFTTPAGRSAPRVRDVILAAMDRVANKALGR